MLIFLIGFMGSGKTTAGEMLAKNLGYDFADLDLLIEEQEGKEITEIFAGKGEDYFRQIESEILRSLSGRKNLVVASGGGTPCYYNNMQEMKRSGVTVYLSLSPSLLAQRLEKQNISRPLVKGVQGKEMKGHVRKLLAGREGWYRQADIIYNADNFDIGDLLEKIKNYTAADT